MSERRGRDLHETSATYDQPTLKSDEEAADWYSANDTSNVDVEELPLPPRGGLLPVAIRLPEAEVKELKRRAGRLGIGYTTYIRMLVNRHVLDEPPIG